MKRVIFLKIAGLSSFVLNTFNIGNSYSRPKKPKKRGGSRHGVTVMPIDKNNLFWGQELLGRVTDSSITVNVLAKEDLDIFFEYGIKPGEYSGKTETKRYKGKIPVEIEIKNLKINTKYYYRMNYKKPGDKSFSQRKEHSFHTQRAQKGSFIFIVEADPHMDENSDPELYKQNLKMMQSENADFLIDLGDIFMPDKIKDADYDIINERYLELRSYFDIVGHTLPVFLTLGNHDGEKGRGKGGRSSGLLQWSTKARRLYFPNPYPDKFYSGNLARDKDDSGKYFEDYYSWEWGDALFIVLDLYRYSNKKSRDREKDKSRWDATLGKEQYEWFKNTLEKSKAKYKFVFIHQLAGGAESGRGGVEAAKYAEWGGYDYDGKWAFDKYRKGWAKPVHQLMVDNNVTVLFHGHDHFYAKQELDNIIYQLGPQPSHGSYNVPRYVEEYSYKKGVFRGNYGYLKVTVSPDKINVEHKGVYKKSHKKESDKSPDSYTIKKI